MYRGRRRMGGGVGGKVGIKFTISFIWLLEIPQ
jgi:hypothetical protein